MSDGTSQENLSARPAPLLLMRDVVYSAAWGSLRVPAFSLSAGRCALIQAEHMERAAAWCDLAQGLTDPDAGEVRFNGEDWARIPPGRAACLRGGMGRVFSGRAWLSNLDVDENVTLRIRHHTRRPLADIDREVDDWTRRFDLSAVPIQRPAWAPVRLLAISQWIRALLGSPDLVLMECPEEDVDEPDLDRLQEALRSRADQGGATVVFTSHREMWQTERMDHMDEYVLSDKGLQPVGDTA